MPGGGGGHIADMINTIARNADLLTRRRFRGYMDKFERRKGGHIDLDFKHASPAELRAFHEKLLWERRKKLILQYVVGAIFFILAVVATILFVRW